MATKATAQKMPRRSVKSDKVAIVYQYALDVHERSTQHFESQDTKASYLGAAVGIMLSLLGSLSPSLFGGGLSGGLVGCSQGFFTLGIALLCWSLVQCVLALKLRKILDYPQAKHVFESSLGDSDQARNMDAEQLTIKLAKGLADSQASYELAAQSKKTHVNTATWCVLFGVSAIALAGGLSLLHLFGKFYD